MIREGYTITDLADFYDFSHYKFSSRNGHKITRIIPHHMAGNLTQKQYADIMHSNRSMSATVSVYTDGTVVAWVPEEMRAWTTGGFEADCCALTLEIANDGGAETGWHISDKAYFRAIEIMARWCLQYDIEPVYTYRGNGINMHRDWAATECPAEYLANIIKSGQMEKDIRQLMDELQHRPQINEFVECLYQTVLGRKADKKGSAYWVNSLVTKEKNAKDVVLGFFESDEYINKEKEDSEFVDDCYRGILQREADKRGKAYWVSCLANDKTRKQVLDGFISSKEFKEFATKYELT